MQIFRHPADRLPITLFTLLFAGDLAVYALVDSPAWLLAWVALGLIPRGGICAFNHHHQHLSVFKHALPNRLLEIMYGIQTGMMSHAWVLHHSLGHHVHYLDQGKDESRWQRDDGARMNEVEYALVVGATAYPRMWRVARRLSKHQAVFLVMGALTIAIVVALVVHRPVPGAIVLAGPMVAMVFHTAWATYSHHAGKRTDSHFVASNNIMHRQYNILTGNLGYHTAHHYRPGVHWSALPALHDTIAHRIPADCYLTPGFPWNVSQRVVGPPQGMPFAPGSSAAAEAPSRSDEASAGASVSPSSGASGVSGVSGASRV